MNTDREPDLAARPSDKFLLKRETHDIIGCAFEVLNELGHGLNEKCYENSLMVEFGLQGISCSQQRQYQVLYKQKSVGRSVYTRSDCFRFCISGCKSYRPHHRSRARPD